MHVTWRLRRFDQFWGGTQKRPLAQARGLFRSSMFIPGSLDLWRSCLAGTGQVRTVNACHVADALRAATDAQDVVEPRIA